MATSRTNRTTEAETSANLAAAQRLQNQDTAVAEEQRKTLAETYKGQEQIEVIGAPMYRAWFGNSMPISINGILITVPLDGKRYKIPKSFARIFNARIQSINEDIELAKKRSNVSSNFEQFPGQLDLVKPV